jgi:hypothetical protein
MRQNSRITGRGICVAVALVITVTVCGVPAAAPAALASSAVASAATHSALASSPQGPETRQVPDGIGSCVLYFTARTAIDKNTILNACSLVSLVPPTHDPIYFRLIGLAVGACAAAMRRAGAGIFNSVVGCGLSAAPTPISQEEWCQNTVGTGCPNAWGGGPWVNDYTGGFEAGDTNQDFFLSAVDNANGNATGNYQLVFAGSSSWAGQCIGDAYNNSGYADTSLDGCGNGTGGGSGWGTNFTIGTSGCSDGEGWFHNNHWNGYLAGSGANGSHFYLNDQTKFCFSIAFF